MRVEVSEVPSGVEGSEEVCGLRCPGFSVRVEGLKWCVHCVGCAARCPLTNWLKKAKTLDQEYAHSMRRVCALSGGLFEPRRHDAG